MSRAIKCGHELLIHLMLFQETDEDPNEDPGSLPALSYFGMADAVQQLLDRGADPGARDRNGEPALHKAVRSGHLDVIEALLKHGAEVNEPGLSGMTAMHWAALNGRTDVAECLMQHDVELSQPWRGDGNLTPLSVATLMGYEEMSSLLESSGATY